MIYKIAAALKKVLPHFLYNWFAIIYKAFQFLISPFKKFFFKIKLRKIQNNHRKALGLVKGKEKIKVAFFLIHESVWKYEGLYKLMEEDERFEPIVIVCPYISYGEENMLKDMGQAYISFRNKGYNVIKTLDDKTGKWLDVNNEIKPDMVFFTNPYSLTKSEYLIKNYENTLTFYVPYGFMITDRPLMQYNQELHNLVFKIFHETSYQNFQARKYSSNKGVNSIVTGFPGIDLLIFPNSLKTKDVWKNKRRASKRIIWAPHHTIEKKVDEFNYSCFLEFSEFMLEIADKYKDKIDFAFKPHPLLKAKLKKLPDWGEEKTNDYYKEWANRSNTQLCDGDYIDLFLTSDAMIHDSGSFLVEYISTNKPSLYMIRNNIVLDGFSELGNLIVDCHYKSYKEEDVLNFIENIILEENDFLNNKRELVIKEKLQPPNKKTASENIFKEVLGLIE